MTYNQTGSEFFESKTWAPPYFFDPKAFDKLKIVNEIIWQCGSRRSEESLYETLINILQGCKWVLMNIIITQLMHQISRLWIRSTKLYLKPTIVVKSVARPKAQSLPNCKALLERHTYLICFFFFNTFILKISNHTLKFT